MFGLGFSALFPLNESSGKPQLRTFLKEKANQFFRNPPFVALTLLVVAYLITGPYSNDLGEWFWRVRTKSPFLFLPLTFFLLSPWTKETYDKVLAFFVLLMSLSASYILIYFLLNQEEMIELLRVGKTIPTPCHHIRYSLMLAIGGIISTYLLLYHRKKEYQTLWVVGFILLTIALHVLSVRSGILAYYIGIFWLAIRHMFSSRRPWISFGVIILLFSAPFLAYNLIPSFKQKVDYVRYDLQQYEKNDGQNYSDSERLMSWKAGWSIFRENPILGVGIGDLRQACKEYYITHYQREKSKFPHNQFLFVLAGCGLLGALIFFSGYFGPLILAKPEYGPLFTSIYLILTASLMVENTVETAVGTAITIFWIVFFVKQSHDLPRPHTAQSREDDMIDG
jgi:O-antigen ligase